MSRETIFKEGAWVGGYEFRDKHTLELDMKHLAESIEYFKRRLYAMVHATPRDIAPQGEEPLQYIQNEFEDIWEALEDDIFALGRLHIIENNEEYIDKGEEP